MTFRALLKDAFLEMADRRVSRALMAVSLLVAIACACLRYDEQPPRQIVERIASGATRIQIREEEDPALDRLPSTVERFEGSGGAFGGRAVWSAGIVYRDAGRFHESVRRWQRSKEGGSSLPQAGNREEPPPPPEVQAACVEDRWRRAGFQEVEARSLPGEMPRFALTLRTDRPKALAAAHQVRFLSWRIPVPGIAMTDLVLGIQRTLANGIAGWFGILIAIVVMAGSLSDLFQKGGAEILLAKPVGRNRLLLEKYAAGLLFVAFHATLLIGGGWLGLSVGSGVWNFGFLGSILIVTFLFAVFSAVMTAVAVASPSPGLQILTALGVWIASSVAETIRSIGSPAPGIVGTAGEWLYWILPKTGALKELNVALLTSGISVPGAFAGTGAGEAGLPWPTAIGTTVLFTAGVLALACFLFRRKDF